jgi:hypothetical protein
VPSSPANTALFVPFGRLDGRLVEPAGLPSGLQEGLACPGCGDQLIVRHPKAARSHFAHYREAGHEGCAESAVHAAAKQVLADAGVMRLPAQRETCVLDGLGGILIEETRQHKAVSRATFERVELEVTIENIRPDALGYLSGGRRLAIEFFFRHRVDETKRVRIRELGLDAIEVDLSDMDGLQGLAAIHERVVSDIERKTWLNYAHQAQTLAAAEKAAQERLERRLAEVGRVRAADEAYRARRRERAMAPHVAFAALTPMAKLEDACARMKVRRAQLTGEVFGVPVPGERAFGVPSLIWQADFYAVFVHRPPRSGILASAATELLARRFSCLHEIGEAERKKAVLAYCHHLKYRGKLRLIYRPENWEVVDPSFLPRTGSAPGPLERPLSSMSSYRWTHIDEERLEMAVAAFEHAWPAPLWRVLANGLSEEAMSEDTPMQYSGRWASQHRDVGMDNAMRFLAHAGVIVAD